jgi:Phage-related protein, tail component
MGVLINNDPVLKINRHPILIDHETQVVLDLTPGESLEAFLHRHIENMDGQPMVVTVGGKVVKRELWAHVFPKQNHSIEVRFGVQKSALLIVALVVLSIFTMGAAAAVAAAASGAAAGTGIAAGFAAGMAAAGLSATASMAVIGAIQVVGAMIINKVLGPKPPKPPSIERDSVYSIGSTRNQVRQYEPAGLLLGSVRVTPDVITIPYTMYQDNDQYLNMVLSPGINVNRYDQLYIGDSPITNYEGQRTWSSGFAGMADQTIPLFTNVDTTSGGALEAEPGTPGAYVTRTTSMDTIRIQVDISFLLFDLTSKGKKKNNQERIEIQYATAGSGNWVFAPQQPSLVSDKQSENRRTYGWDVPRGQYDVRLRRLGRNTDGKGATAEFNWASLVSVQADEANYRGLARIGVQLKATGQLSGTPDEIRAIMYANPMPVWDGVQWNTATDRSNGLSNPGAQALQYLRGFRDSEGALIAGLGLSDNQIDIESYKSFMVHCTLNNYTFDYWMTDSRTHDEILSMIMLAGMGRYSWSPGRITALWAAKGQGHEGVVNMGNIKKGEFQIDYSLAQAADGIEYTYVDRVTWEPKTLRVPAPGVTVMENPARLTGEGIGTEAHAAIMARYHMAQNIYQFKDIVFSQDIEHLAYGQMSIIQLQHDLTQWGYGGRLLEATRVSGAVVLRFDEPVPAPASGNAYVGLRIPGETGYRVFQIRTFSGNTDTVTLVGVWPNGVPFPGDTESNPVWDTLYLYDFKQTPGLRCRVTGIQPGDDLSGASISVVPESDEFWHYVETGEYIPPKNESLLRTQPQVTNLRVREERIVQGDTVFSMISATWRVTGYSTNCIVTFGKEGDPPITVADTNTLTASWRVDDVGRYIVKVLPIGDNGIPGIAAAMLFDVAGADLPPVNPDLFTILEVAGGLRNFNWGWYADTIQSPDFAGVEIRFAPGFAPAVWDNMTPLAAGDHGGGFYTDAFETSQPPKGQYTFALRAINTAGILASEMVVVQKTLNFNLGEVIEQVEEGVNEAFSRIFAETQNRVDAINEVVEQVQQNATEADQKIAAETAARQQEVGRLEDDIAANASALLNEKLEREAAINNEADTRQSAYESLAYQISQISAGTGQQFDSKKIWYFDENAEGWNGTASGGFLNPGGAVANSPVGLGVDSTSYRYVKMRVKRVGNPVWLGKISWKLANNSTGDATATEPTWDANGIGVVDLDDIPWSGGTLNSISIQLGAAVSGTAYFLFDYIAVGRPTPGASVAMVQEETQARIAGDQAEAFQRNTLAVQMRGDYTGTDVAALQQGLVFNERNARINGDEILATEISSLQVRAGNIESSVTTETQARIDGDTALAEQITTLNSELDGKADASVVNQLTTRVEETEEGLTAVSQSVLKLDAQISPRRAGDTDWRAGDKTIRAGARTIYSVIADGDRALASQMTTLNAEFGDFKSGVTDQIEVISDDVSAQAQALLSLTATVAGKADASAVQLLTSRVEETEFGITALGQSIDQINVSLAGKADASAVTALQATVSDLDGKVSANSTAITNVSAQVAGKAEASVVQQLSADVQTVNGVVTSINAQYFLAVEANGLIGGMKIGNNGNRVDFAIQADRFAIVPPNSSGQRFEYSNGNIRAYHNNGNLCFRAGTW